MTISHKPQGSKYMWVRLFAAMVVVLVATQMMLPVLAARYIRSIRIEADKYNVGKNDTVEVTVGVELASSAKSSVGELIVRLKEDDLIFDDQIDWIRLDPRTHGAVRFTVTPSRFTNIAEGSRLEIYAEVLVFSNSGDQIERQLSSKIYIRVR